jgi:hypothetical protein
MDPVSHLRTYTLTELEQIAANQLRSLGDNFTIPVDIEDIVEQCGIDLDIKRGLADRGIMGQIGTNLDTGKFIIKIDEKLFEARHNQRICRMTIAEEFAHFLLHRKTIENVKTYEDAIALKNHPHWHKYERNAKWLAAALLIPAGHVLNDSRELYKQLVSSAGFVNPTAVKKYIRNLLADKYDVSVSAMKYRLEKWPANVMEKIDKAMRDKLDFLD